MTLQRRTPLRSDPATYKAWRERSAQRAHARAVAAPRQRTARVAGVQTTTRLRAAERLFEQAKDVVRRRSKGLCERCGWQRAAHFHHRLPRGMGGSSRAARSVHRPSNLLHLCSACHDTVEAYRERAYILGLLVHRGQDPACVPVALGLEPLVRCVLLDDDGEVRTP